MLRAPELLTADHDSADFCSGVPSLDDWPRRRALQHQASGASRTFVVCDDARVVGCYALAAGAIAPHAAPGRFRRNMPAPIRVAVLGRLAVDKAHQGCGLGRAPFRDAAQRVVGAAGSIGVRGLMVHAISDEAKASYVVLGLCVSPVEPMMFMVTVADLEADLE